jgi:hypothetical protein
MLAKLSDDVDAEQIAYFATSVIWRGCSMNLGCKLGAYEPQFRQYLLDQAPFPNAAVLSMGVLEQTALTASPYGWITEPSSVKAGPLWLHGFMLAGLTFRCLVGKTISPILKAISLSGPGDDKYVSLLKPGEYADFLAAASMAAAATPKGKLADAIG